MSEPHPAMRLLRAGVPLSLLLDLADPNGPDTRGIMAAERRAADEAIEESLLSRSRTLAVASSARASVVRGMLPDSA